MDMGVLFFIVVVMKKEHIYHPLLAFMLIGVDVLKLKNPHNTNDIVRVYPFAGWCPEDLLGDPPVPGLCELMQP